MPFALGLLLGIVWAIKPARDQAEKALVFAPSAVFVLLYFVTVVFQADWMIWLFFAVATLCVVATFGIGHQLRGRRMQEAMSESEED